MELDLEVLEQAYYHMCLANEMAHTYEENRKVCTYVHSTSRGHEAIQLATARQLLPCDYVSPYYRDESLLLGLGFDPYTLMLQLLAKQGDMFTGGRSYYSHPNSRDGVRPAIIHQSSATGMQAIPSTGIAQGLQYLERIQSPLYKRGAGGERPIVICSMGDASVTEGEVSEAFQVAALWQLPIIYLVQDNGWGISVAANEARTANAYEYAAGFPGLDRVEVDGSDFLTSCRLMAEVADRVRTTSKPTVVRAVVPLLGHHTSGVRKEFYRTPDDIEKHAQRDPKQILRRELLNRGIEEQTIMTTEARARHEVLNHFARAVAAKEPETQQIHRYVFAPAGIEREKGIRQPQNRSEKISMVDAALFAVREILQENPEAIFFGQDVGKRLGGVFREAATLGEQFGDHRVFNTAIQEAYIIGSTVGLSAVGVKPIVEVQFADYIFPGFNQLVTEVAKSCYLTMGKFPVSMILRVPTGAYGGGGPYHSASIESFLTAIKGIKIAFPSNAADMKGLMKTAFDDPNPVVMLEHKGLYWSKMPGTSSAKRIEPSADYRLPFGKGNIVLKCNYEKLIPGETCCVITYGMGVYWSLEAARNFEGRVEILDLRTLVPWDEELVMATVKKHGKCLIVSEEQQEFSFAESLAGRIGRQCFQFLDAPVQVLGAMNLPAVPLNRDLEQTMLPNAQKVSEKIGSLLDY